MTDDLQAALTDINTEHARLQAAAQAAQQQPNAFEDNISATVANLRATLPQPEAEPAAE